MPKEIQGDRERQATDCDKFDSKIYCYNLPNKIENSIRTKKIFCLKKRLKYWTEVYDKVNNIVFTDWPFR